LLLVKILFLIARIQLLQVEMSILHIHNLIAWTILTMYLITSRGRQVSIPQEAYGLVSDPALRFHQNILICVPKTNEGLTGLEQHEGE